MEWFAPILFLGLYTLLAVLGIAIIILLGTRIYSTWRENQRRALVDTTRAKLTKALQELADPNNNGLSWVVKPLSPKSLDEAAVLRQVMMEIATELSDEDRWRLSELYEASGVQSDDMRIVKIAASRWYERAQAVYRLGQMRCASAMDALTTALRDSSEDVRLMAIWALAEIGDDRAVQPVVISLADANGWELMQAANCLLGMSSDLTLPLLDLLNASGPKRDRRERIASTVLDLLAEFGHHARDRLNTRACRKAADELLKSDSIDIRARAVRALTALGVDSEEEFQVFLNCLRDIAWEVRAVTARALGKLNMPEAIPYLCQAVSDEAWQVRHNAAHSLGDLGDAGHEALKELIHSQDRFAREMAQEVIEQLHIA